MDNKIYITDEQGNEKEMEIVLSFALGNKEFVIVSEGEDSEDSFLFSYDDAGNLYAVEDEEELEAAAEILEAFQSEVEDA